MAKIGAIEVIAVKALGALLSVASVALQAVADARALHTLRADEDVAESLPTVCAGKVGVACGIEDASGSVEVGSTVARLAN